MDARQLNLAVLQRTKAQFTKSTVSATPTLPSDSRAPLSDSHAGKIWEPMFLGCTRGG